MENDSKSKPCWFVGASFGSESEDQTAHFLTDVNRKAIAKDLANFLGVEKSVPDTFEGIPILNNQKSWFFGFEDRRQSADETKAFIDNAFRDGAIPVTGTAITKILPPVSRFNKSNGHAVKKQTVLDKLSAFERFFGLAERGEN